MWPIVLHWHDITLYSYPLFIGLAWGLGFRKCEEALPSSIKYNEFVIWFVGVFFSSWIGAKVLFLITQNQFKVSDLSRTTNFWLGGGFVYLGGLIGGLIFCSIIGSLIPSLKLNKMQFTIIPLLWSHAIGRIGCLLAGCCYGTHSNLPWSIHLHGLDRHPVQLYEAIALSLLALVLMRLKKENAYFLTIYLIGYGLIRWTLEWLRADEIRGMAFNMSTSQWVSLGLVVAGLLKYYQLFKASQTFE